MLSTSWNKVFSQVFREMSSVAGSGCEQFTCNKFNGGFYLKQTSHNFNLNHNSFQASLKFNIGWKKQIRMSWQAWIMTQFAMNMDILLSFAGE